MVNSIAFCCRWFGASLLPFIGFLIGLLLSSQPQLERWRKSTIEKAGFLAKESPSEENSRDLAFVDPGVVPFPVMPASVADWNFHSRPRETLNAPFPAAADTEAQAALRQAKHMYSNGRTEKAQRLFQRALQFSPGSADALAAYGEFLHREKDPIEAEKLLAKALQVRPDHIDAQRVMDMNSAVVHDMDRELFASIDKKSGTLLTVPRDNPAFIRALRENYVKHIYHSNAIEGNTLTLAMVRSILETGLAVAGKSIREHNDILGLELALNYVHQNTIKKRGLTVSDVMALHNRIMGHSQPLDAGKFRDTQVFVANHVPPPPKYLHELMERYDKWLVSSEAASLHPIARAAMDHFKLVHIHPFIDGNGRLSRLIMNIRLMQGGYPPVIIPVQERFVYYEKLALADQGDVRPFIRYIANLTEHTIDEYLLFTQKQIDETPVPAAAATTTTTADTTSVGGDEAVSSESTRPATTTTPFIVPDPP